MNKRHLLGEEYEIIFRGRQTESRREIQTPCLIRDSNIAQTITKPSSTNTITDPKVFNLSSRNLTACEIQLLSKGLKYTPTPQRNHHELKTDIKIIYKTTETKGVLLQG